MIAQIAMVFFCSSPAEAACTSPAANIGALDFQTNQFKFCDGTNWVGMITNSFPHTGPNGTVSAPTYSFSASTNTGMYSTGVGTLAFATAGAQAMTITNTGNVGIGTTAPNFVGTGGRVTTIYGGNGNLELASNAADGAATTAGRMLYAFDSNSTSHKIISSIEAVTEGATANQRGGVLQFFTKSNANVTNSERMRIDSNGNVGIGTTTPSDTLDVNGTAKATATKVGDYVSEKMFSAQFGTGANQKVQIYWPAGTRHQGLIEITVASGFENAQASGFIRKRFGLHVSEVGGMYFQEVSTEALGATYAYFTISDFLWDATNSRWYVIVANLGSAQNTFTVHVKTINASTSSSIHKNAAASNAQMTAVYSTDATVYPALATALGTRNVGINTTSPNFLGVNSGSRVLTITADPGSANYRGVLELRNPLAASNSNNGSIFFASGGTASNASMARIESTAEGAGGASGFGSNLSFTTKADNGAEATRLFINSVGRVGINTSNPFAKLAVTDTAGDSNSPVVWIAAGGSDGQLGLGVSTTYSWIQSHNGKPLRINELANDVFIVPNSGNVGIGTTTASYKLHVVGTAGLSTGTAWTNASDARLKKIDGDFEYGLDEILKLHTVRFHYKEDNALGLPSSHPMTGFIAQEVQKVIPDAVSVGAKGYLQLNVDPIHWATVNAVQELHGMCKATDERVVTHDREIASLKAENRKIKEENAIIKAYLCSKDPAAPICH